MCPPGPRVGDRHDPSAAASQGRAKVSASRLAGQTRTQCQAPQPFTLPILSLPHWDPSPAGAPVGPRVLNLADLCQAWDVPHAHTGALFPKSPPHPDRGSAAHIIHRVPKQSGFGNAPWGWPGPGQSTAADSAKTLPRVGRKEHWARGAQGEGAGRGEHPGQRAQCTEEGA